MAKQVQYISANELVKAASAASEAALASLLASFGIVQIAVHPETVPQQTAPRAQGQQSTRRGTRAGQGQTYNTGGVVGAARASVPTQQRPASVTPDVPHCTVSSTYRTRVPKPLFDAGEGQLYEYVLLITPSGVEYRVNCDEEGRSRIPSAWLEGDAGHEAYFHEIEPGVYQVNISGRVSDPAPTRTSQQPASNRVTPAVDANVFDEFDETPAQGQRAPRRVQPKCATCNRVFVKAEGQSCQRCIEADIDVHAQASGVVGGGTRAEARATRITPRHVSPEPAQRPAPRADGYDAKLATLARMGRTLPTRTAARTDAQSTAAALRTIPTRGVR